MNTYILKVCEIRIESADAVTICFKQPALRKIRYIAGQYLTLIFRINGRRYVRPYSFSSSPSVDQSLDITVKRVEHGIVSNHIIDTLKVGDSVEVMPPMGDFILNLDKGYHSIYLWGVGSGITPLFSIAKQVLVSDPKIIVHIIYGNRNRKSAIFFDELLRLQEHHGDRLTVAHFHSGVVVNEKNCTIIEGRIDRQKAEEFLLMDVEFVHAGHFICGPAGLKYSLKNLLTEKGVNEGDIFSEDFELVKNPGDFHDIQTRNIKLHFEGEEVDLEIGKGITILEAALNAGIDLPYSCQTGNCNTCKGILVEGKSRMIGLNKKREDLDENEILLCCSHPLTDNVYIKL